jgi:hypothetical protein
MAKSSGKGKAIQGQVRQSGKPYGQWSSPRKMGGNKPK